MPINPPSKTSRPEAARQALVKGWTQHTSGIATFLIGGIIGYIIGVWV